MNMNYMREENRKGILYLRLILFSHAKGHEKRFKVDKNAEIRYTSFS